jgi:hypothetical protein
VTGQSNVAALLNQSPQVVKNWEDRGVSFEGAILAEAAIGCRAAWLKLNAGTMASDAVAPFRISVRSEISR